MNRDYNLSRMVWCSEDGYHLQQIGSWLFLIDEEDIFLSACFMDFPEKVAYFKEINEFYDHDPLGAKDAVENAMRYLGLIEARSSVLEALYNILIYNFNQPKAG